MRRNWNRHVTVWINDPDKKTVVVGPYGFAWWKRQRVFVAPFKGRVDNLVSAFKNFDDWESVRDYEIARCPKTAVYRFVRTGLLPPTE